MYKRYAIFIMIITGCASYADEYVSLISIDNQSNYTIYVDIKHYNLSGQEIEPGKVFHNKEPASTTQSLGTLDVYAGEFYTYYTADPYPFLADIQNIYSLNSRGENVHCEYQHEIAQSGYPWKQLNLVIQTKLIAGDQSNSSICFVHTIK